MGGGEDQCYKVFDTNGILLFSSQPCNNVITSLAWAPSGEVFAVGSFDSLKICNHKGWSHSQDTIGVNSSITDIEWMKDETQLCVVCGDGSIVLSDLIGKQKFWGDLSAELMETYRLL